MWQFVVLYRRPDDPEAFERYYRSVHVPLVKKFPGLRRMHITKTHGDAGSADEIFLISAMLWDDRAGLEAALQSPERNVAYEDSARFRQYQLGRYIGEVEDV